MVNMTVSGKKKAHQSEFDAFLEGGGGEGGGWSSSQNLMEDYRATGSEMFDVHCESEPDYMKNVPFLPSFCTGGGGFSFI